MIEFVKTLDDSMDLANLEEILKDNFWIEIKAEHIEGLNEASKDKEKIKHKIAKHRLMQVMNFVKCFI